MKLAVVGSRTFNNFELLNEIIWGIFGDICVPELGKLDTIISGGAKGADSIAKRWALINEPVGIKYIEHLPEWNEHGKKAGYIRNQFIINDCDILLAFWDGKSKGTKHSIELAKKAKKPTFIVYF